VKAGNRREFLSSIAAGVTAAPALAAVLLSKSEPVLQTVLGATALSKLNITLMHEHVLVDFVGADQVRKDRYNPEEVFKAVLPHLKRTRELGCRTLVECTPAYLGRDPLLLKKLSEASMINLVTNTGYYGAANYKYLPAHAHSESAEQLARRWITEFEEGIEGSGIKPGLIKIGVNNGPLSDMDRKLARAAAKAHRATGLTIASHTGNGAAALEQMSILKEEGVQAAAFIWVHAQNEPSRELQVKAAEQGAWLEFEGFAAASLEKQAQRLKTLIDLGYISQILISLDAGWYRVGEPGGGQFRSYAYFFTNLLPALRKIGVTEEQIQRLIRKNPREALNPKLRTL
jgi:phosphotriesterase-related protein